MRSVTKTNAIKNFNQPFWHNNLTKNTTIMNTATLSTAIKTVNKEQFIEKFTPLVKRVAHHMMAKLPDSVEMDDLIRAGMAGLMDAIKRYRGSYDQQFESYAAQRIRVSILDQLRGANLAAS